MTMTKKTFDSLLATYPFDESDLEDVFEFMIGLLDTEIQATKRKYPDASTTIVRMEKAREVMWNMYYDVMCGEFDD